MTESAGRECWRCRVATADAVVCARCGAVQPVGPTVDLFAVLGLPRSPHLDPVDLERRYHTLSRAVHPDRHQTADPAERDLSLATSAAVNRAYRTLRDPVALGRYWLELHGDPLGEGNQQVPPGIATEVFDAQEKLEELRGASAGPAAESLRADVVALRDQLGERLRAQRGQLIEMYAGWHADGAPLARLKRLLSEIAYLTTLFGDLDETVGEGIRGTHSRH